MIAPVRGCKVPLSETDALLEAEIASEDTNTVRMATSSHSENWE
jgi:hypothetical protein